MARKTYNRNHAGMPWAGDVKITHSDGTVSVQNALTYAQRRNLAQTGDKNRRPVFSKRQRERIYERDGYVCRWCGTDKGPFHLDHIRPYSKGGHEHDSNLVTACAPCNARRGNKWSGETQATV